MTKKERKKARKKEKRKKEKSKKRKKEKKKKSKKERKKQIKKCRKKSQSQNVSGHATFKLCFISKIQKIEFLLLHF